VFEHGEITPESVGLMFRRAIRSFYFRPRYIIRQAAELASLTGLRHRLLAATLLVKLAIFGGKRKVRVKS
jgi:hypothetical protein